jgi:hypothetical protein
LIMRTLICLLVLTFACIAGYGQTHAPASQSPAKKRAASSKVQQESQAPSTEEVLKLLNMLQISDDLKITLDAMKTQMKHGSEQLLREKIAKPTADQLKQMNDIVDQEFAGISMDDLIRDVVPVYQRHLTRFDVEALIAFYSSPVGQKLRREQPAMMRETMQATSAKQRQKMEDLLARVELRLEQFIQSEQNK